MDSLRTPKNITALDGSCYEAVDLPISQNIFSYLKIFTIQCRENITVEDNEKIMNIANFMSIAFYEPQDARWTSSENLFILINRGIYKNETCCIVVYFETIWLN